MTRDMLVSGPVGLSLKPTIALHHGGIFPNSYSVRDSAAIPHTPWYVIKKKSLFHKPRHFRIFKKKSTEQGSSF